MKITLNVCTFVSVLVLGTLVGSTSTSEGVQHLSICREGTVAGYSSSNSFNDSRSKISGTGTENNSAREEEVHVVASKEVQKGTTVEQVQACVTGTIRTAIGRVTGALINPLPSSMAH